ncbi:amidohydrolase [Ruminococcus sp. AF18-22]|nr:amidohydrolase [Ruminococcus sp. AF18-22]
MIEKADKIFKSACIFDSVSEKVYPGYIAIKGTRILEVGRGNIPSRLVSASTEVVDYGERTICPGFGDTHTFFTGYVVDYLGEDLSEVLNLQKVMELLSEKVKNTPEVMVLFGNHIQMELAEKINKEGVLEQIQRPVILFTAGHEYCAMNKVAEEVFGFTPDTCGSSEAIYKIMKIYLNDREFIIPQFKAYMSMLNRHGITSVKEIGFDNFYGFTDILAELEQKAELSLRISFMSQPVGKKMDLEYGKEMKRKYHSDFLRFSGYNQMTDGLILSEEADLMEPYEGKEYCCKKYIDYTLLEEDVLAADREGFRFTLHSEGDGSFHKILQIYDKCEKENGKLKNRHGITDLELTGAEDEKKMAQLGVFGEIYAQVYKLDSCENWKRDYDEKLGSRRSRYMNYRSLADYGVILSGATDLPMLIPDIPEAIYYGCGTYAADAAEQVQPKNGLTIQEMLKTWTVGSQYAMGQEHILGTLESGKQADIVIFDRNLFKADIKEIRKAHVLRTICAGRDVYKEMENS